MCYVMTGGWSNLQKSCSNWKEKNSKDVQNSRGFVGFALIVAVTTSQRPRGTRYCLTLNPYYPLKKKTQSHTKTQTN